MIGGESGDHLWKNKVFEGGCNVLSGRSNSSQIKVDCMRYLSGGGSSSDGGNEGSSPSDNSDNCNSRLEVFPPGNR